MADKPVVVGKVEFAPLPSGPVDTRAIHRAPLRKLLAEVHEELLRVKAEHAQRHGGVCFGCGQSIHLNFCRYVALVQKIERALA